MQDTMHEYTIECLGRVYCACIAAATATLLKPAITLTMAGKPSQHAGFLLIQTQPLSHMLLSCFALDLVAGSDTAQLLTLVSTSFEQLTHVSWQ